MKIVNTVLSIKYQTCKLFSFFNRIVTEASLCDYIFYLKCRVETLSPVENIYKYTLILSFAEGSEYKLIDCKSDSSVACTCNRFIYLFCCCCCGCLLLNLHRRKTKKTRNFNREECLGSPHTGYRPANKPVLYNLGIVQYLA